MQDVKNCEFCGEPFLVRKHHYAQKYCSRECRIQAQNNRDRERNRERVERIKEGHRVSSGFRVSEPYCGDLWKQYRRFERLHWIDKMASFERKLREKGCWFRRKFGLSKEQKQLAEKRESKIA